MAFPSFGMKGRQCVLQFAVTKFYPLPPRQKKKKKKKRKEIVKNRKKKLSKCERALGTARRECSVLHRTKLLTLKMIVATKEELSHKVQHLVNCKEHFISVINTRLITVAHGFFFYSLYAFFQNIKTSQLKQRHSHMSLTIRNKII